MVRTYSVRTPLAGIFLILVLFMTNLNLHAQGGATGAIAGSVVDASSGAVAGAKVDVINASTNELIRTETTDSGGLFTFTLLPAGAYTVRVSVKGFAETFLRNVDVRVTETTRLSVNLKTQTIQEKVEVTAEVLTVKTTDSTTGGSLSGQTIRDLPLATRNFQQLLSLSAGASSSLNSASQLGRGDVRINVNGGREDNNNYQIDGIGANDPTNEGELAYTPLPSPDAIQEFKVSTSLYDATQGRNGGGNINAVLKSGSSDFHFDAFEYFRNTSLNANDFFVKRHELQFGEPETKPAIQQNIFGASGGGPIGPKAKLGYFFVNYQGTRQRSGDSPGTIISTTLPLLPTDRSAANLQSIFFPQGLPPGAGNGIDPVVLQLLQLTNNQFKNFENPQGFLFPSGASVPGTVCNATDPNCNQPGINPTTGAIHNGPFLITKPGRFTDNQFTTNWDREFRAGHDHISGRFFYSNVEVDQPFGGDSFTLQTGGVPMENNLNFPMNTFVRDRFGSLAETHTFSSSLVNEFRFGVSVIGWRFKTVPIVTAQQLGIQRPTNNATNDIYRIQFNAAGFQFGPYPTQPFTNLSDTLSYLDTVSYVKGAHSFRFGGEIDRTDVRKNIPVADNGFLFFGPTGAAPTNFPSPLADFQNFLIGNLGGSLTDSGVSTHDYGIPAFALFAQDDYRITRSLTLNLGFRTDFQGATYDKFCHTANIDPTLTLTTGQPFVYPNCVAQFNLPGVTGTVGRDNLNNNYATIWEPRIGFAYDVFGHHTTSIRGGYGIYSIREDAGALDNLTLQPPFVPGAAPFGVQAGGLSTFLQGMIPPVGVLSSSFIPQPSFFRGFSAAGCNPDGTPASPTPNSNLNPCFTGNIPFFFSPLIPLHFIAPTMQQWNLSIQHSFGNAWTVELGYVGTKATHLREVSNSNQARVATPANPVIIKGASCDGSQIGSDQQCAITHNTFANINARAPFPGLGPFNDENFAPDANSHYHGLQATVTHRFSAGLYLQSAYTFSKSIDDTSSSQVAFLSRFNDNSSGRNTRGLSDFDRKHRWITTLTYTLPFFEKSQGFMQAALGHWDISSVFTLQSGLPFSVFDSAGGGAFGNASPVLATPTFNPGFTCANSLTQGSSESRLNGFINPLAFKNDAPIDDPNSPGSIDPSATGFGNVPRNCFRGPRELNTDFAIGKIFKFGEKSKLKFTTEFFNLTNTASFHTPAVTDINSSAFGTITQVVGTPRLIQFSLRYSY